MKSNFQSSTHHYPLLKDVNFNKYQYYTLYISLYFCTQSWINNNITKIILAAMKRTNNQYLFPSAVCTMRLKFVQTNLQCWTIYLNILHFLTTFWTFLALSVVVIIFQYSSCIEIKIHKNKRDNLFSINGGGGFIAVLRRIQLDKNIPFYLIIHTNISLTWLNPFVPCVWYKSGFAMPPDFSAYLVCKLFWYCISKQALVSTVSFICILIRSSDISDLFLWLNSTLLLGKGFSSK